MTQRHQSTSSSSGSGGSFRIAIGLLSAGVLLLELSVTRLFSALMFYHFGFMAISLAMFGLGASGLFLFSNRARLPETGMNRYVALSCIAAGAGTVLAIALALRIPISLGYSLANIRHLFGIYLLLLIPFFSAGLAISMILYFRSADASRLYAWDLTGAAIGALATVPILNLLGGVDACLAASVLFAGAAVTVASPLKSRVRWGAWVAVAGTAVFLVADATQHVLPLRYLKGQVRRETVFEKWNALSFITVSKIPGQADMALIEIDGDAGTYILRDPLHQIGAQQLRDAVAPGWASSIPNALAGSGRVLVIGPGGGMDVNFALAWGARHVDAVELNPIISHEIMSERYRDFSGGLYQRPDVSLIVDEGRSFVRRSDSRYDLIQLTLVDTWAASAAGAFSLSENHLYTTEAFCDYINHLADDGVLAVTRWIFAKPRETLRLMTTAFAAAQRLGITDPAQHIAIAAVTLPGTQLELASFMFKRSALTTRDIDVIKSRVAMGSGRMVYSPFEKSGNAFDACAQAGNTDQFTSTYEYAIAPTTDDRPFFFNVVRAAQLGRIMTLEPESRKNNLGILNLLAVAIISLVLVVIFFIGPLVFSKQGRVVWRTPGGFRDLSYFVAIGLGFILIEIALMQKFVLYLGHPIYALVVVLASLLVSAGAGSLYTQRVNLKSAAHHQRWLFGGILGLSIVELLLLPLIFQTTLASPLPVRIAVSLIALAPLGFLLGQPFPLGLKRLDRVNRPIIPWAWGLNCAASVLGSVAAICLAMIWGYSVVIVIGAVCYAAAWGCSGSVPGLDRSRPT